MKTQRLSFQVQIESLYHELHAFSFHELSEPFSSVKTKNTSAEVSQVETSSGTERSAEGDLPLPPSKRGRYPALVGVIYDATNNSESGFSDSSANGIATVILTKWCFNF